ncbi:DNA polymerase III subunit beta [bacterium]|nr:DNA polymerase III subunit beta [bacterium]NBX71675.1 DNA polymerase III subunit beta [bacterium]
MQRFIIKKRILIDALSKVIGSVDKKQIHPILSNCLIRLSKTGILTIIGSDLEVQVQVKKNIDVDLDQEIALTLPAKKIYDFCRALGEEATLNFTIEDRRVVLTTPESKLELSSFDAAKFPQLSGDCREIMSIKINQRLLRQAIDSISYAMAIADIRYYLNGLLFQIEGQELTLVATDGHRLACTNLTCSLMPGANQRLTAIVPRRAILELSKLLEQVDEEVDLVFYPQLLAVQINELAFSCKLIEGKYPDYKRVLPKDLPYKIQLDRDQLRQGLGLIQPILSSKDRGVLLTFSEKTVEIKGINNENEQVLVALPIQSGVSPALKIGLNINYLSDFIHATKSKFFWISLQDDSKGVVLTYDGPGFYVVMPLRL